MSFAKQYLKRATLVVGTFVLIAVVLWSLQKQPVPVDQVFVSRGLFERMVVEEGKTRVKRDYIISTPADGILPQLDWSVGDVVKKGQVLFTFISDLDRAVRSPIDGVILEISKKDRQHLSRGIPVLTIANPSDIEIEADILTDLAIDVHPGQLVKIRNWGKNELLMGKVIKIEPKAFEKISALGVSEQRVKVVIGITSDSELWQSLQVGYKVQVQIVVAELHDALMLPLGALFQTPDGFSVFQIASNKAVLKSLTVRDKGAEMALIEGLNEGDSVVLFPGPEVVTGVEVKLRQSEPR